ncbi:MAG: hypothetical protein IJ572_01920 [Bacilli bacterium]|nr:hypothetical protein [Bacilli bacterium]
MKKFLKSRLFAFMLGGILFTSITSVVAFSLYANDVGYTPLDTTWKKFNDEEITNVKDALDELHIKIDQVVLDNMQRLTDGVKFEGEYFYIYTPPKIIWNEASEDIINYEKILFCHKVAGNNTNFTADLPFSIDGKTFDVRLIKKIGNYAWNPSIRPPTSGNHLDVDVNYGYPELAEYYFLILIK